MRAVVLAAACALFLALGAPQAAAQEEAPFDPGAASAGAEREACAPRAGARRSVMGQARPCRAAYASVRRCTYELDVRASALRFATGRRPHARVARCGFYDA